MIEPTLLLGDCLEVMRSLPAESVDAIVTDPPYGLSFMGAKWDYDVPSVEIWQEARRLLKPGGYLLAFAGTRTQHRMAVNIEDAGYEIRDLIAWVYGSGFPKSHNVSLAIDKEAGAKRETIKTIPDRWTQKGNTYNYSTDREQKEVKVTAPATEDAKTWAGWGTALKPALEPITVARKPFAGTVAANVLQYGTGAINVDACRVGKEKLAECRAGQAKVGTFKRDIMVTPERIGRYPANLLHDGSPEVDDLLQGAARFFYCAKASGEDRDAGLSRAKTSAAEKTNRKEGSAGITPYAGSRTPTRNTHPTVKPVELMRYLCRLVTRPGGVVLDPFMGSGSTGRACIEEGFSFIGIERDAAYYDLACERMRRIQLPLFGSGV
jgi:site-specific DNA-methyltransferase (adenine-specific)